MLLRILQPLLKDDSELDTPLIIQASYSGSTWTDADKRIANKNKYSLVSILSLDLATCMLVI